MFGGVESLNEYYGSSNGQIGQDFSLPEIQVSNISQAGNECVHNSNYPQFCG